MKAKIILLALLVIQLIMTSPSYGQGFLKGISNWFNKEVIPTIEGKRDLKIDPTRVRINHDGKDILRVSTEDKGSLYLDFGLAKVQTNDLQKEIARAGAVFSGNTAVMTQVAFEQLEQITKRKLQQAGVDASQEAPILNETPEILEGRQVIIYNHTQSPISYALNEKFYTLQPKTGIKHFAADNDFFLQFDEDVSNNASVARYYLEGTQYSLYLGPGQAQIEILRLQD